MSLTRPAAGEESRKRDSFLYMQCTFLKMNWLPENCFSAQKILHILFFSHRSFNGQSFRATIPTLQLSLRQRGNGIRPFCFRTVCAVNAQTWLSSNIPTDFFTQKDLHFPFPCYNKKLELRCRLCGRKRGNYEKSVYTHDRRVHCQKAYRLCHPAFSRESVPAAL